VVRSPLQPGGKFLLEIFVRSVSRLLRCRNSIHSPLARVSAGPVSVDPSPFPAVAMTRLHQQPRFACA
jgi:hypothetical protein